MKKNWIFITAGILFLCIVIVALVFSLSKDKTRLRPSQQISTISPTETSVAMTVTVDSDLPEDQRTIDAFSAERAMRFLEELTAINAHSGWRGGGTTGEALAFDLVENKLSTMDWLNSQGMTVERESFHVYLATQDNLSKVIITTDTDSMEVDADAVRGNRNDPTASARMDSDGVVGDADSDPVSVEGKIMVIDSVETLQSLNGTNLANTIAVVNYEVVDNSLNMTTATENAMAILDLNPAGILLVTQNSNVVGESHGTFIGDGGGGFQRITEDQYSGVPMLFINIEDLIPLGVSGWDDVQKITNISMEWDVDVLNPGNSGNLIVHIPGKSGGKPVLLSAHIDSPNSPGALDDGSGSAILMEIITALNEQQVVPETDLYLAWYGSEELDLYGSAYFTTTHSELLNQLQANVQVDCLSRPLDGLPAIITLEMGYYNGPSAQEDLLAKYLVDRGQESGIDVKVSYWPLSSDNGPLSAYGISNLNMIYTSTEMEESYAGVWYSGHFHDPYDNIETASDVEDVLGDMGKLVMSMAFIPAEDQVMRSQNFEHKALFMATYTESPQMTLAGMMEVGAAFVNGGYEVNELPYGKELTAEDLEGVDLLFILPPFDYPVLENTVDSYDVRWSEETAGLINDYVQNGGIVVVANNARRLRWFTGSVEENEDWADLNVLTDQWDVHYTSIGTLNDDLTTQATLSGSTFDITASAANRVDFTAPEDSILASVNDQPILVEVSVGSGRVIVLGDLIPLRTADDISMMNPDFVQALIDLN